MPTHGSCARRLLLAAVVLLAMPRNLPADTLTCGDRFGFFSIVTSGSNATLGNNRVGSCGGAGPDGYLRYLAPRTGTYTIDTYGSLFDTVLYVRETTGALFELACNDDADFSSPFSELRVNLIGGVNYDIIIDSYSAGGAYALRINPDCPAFDANDPRDLGSPLSVSVSATTVCAPSNFGAAPCSGGGASAGDTAFLYTAPVTAIYQMTAFSSDFDTILSAYDAGCSGGVLACNDDISFPTNTNSLVTLPLVAGQRVAVNVDGFSAARGVFSLIINAIGCCQFADQCLDGASDVGCSDGGIYFVPGGSCASGFCAAPTATPTSTPIPPTPTDTPPPTITATPTVTFTSRLPTPTSTVTSDRPRATNTATRTPTPRPNLVLPCTGDCDSSMQVSLTEMVRCLRVVNGNRRLSECPRCDRDDDGADLRDLVRALRNTTDGACR